MPFDPNEKLTVELTALEWNQVMATYQEGVVRTLAPLYSDPAKSAEAIRQVQAHLQSVANKLGEQLRGKEPQSMRLVAPGDNPAA